MALPVPPTYFKSASLRLQPLSDDVFVLRSLYSIKPGQGHATGLLQLLMAYADEHRITIRLTARQYGNTHGLDNLQLVAFYKKFGFVMTTEFGTDGFHMIRVPQ